MGNDGATARSVAMAFRQGHCHVLIRQAVKPVPTQTALPCGMGRQQDLLDLGQSVVEGRVETGHLWQIGLLPQQDLTASSANGWCRGQRNVALGSARTFASRRTGMKYLLPPWTIRWATAPIRRPSSR